VQYDFTIDDQYCTYLGLSPSADRLFMEVGRQVCYFAKLPLSIDFQWYRGLQVAINDVGTYTFNGPQGDGDTFNSTLAFRRVGETDYPMLTCDHSLSYGGAAFEAHVSFHLFAKRLSPSESTFDTSAGDERLSITSQGRGDEE
jgi:hypothetical protein